MTTNEEPNGASVSSERGLKMIADAAQLMLRCAGYFGDRQDEANGWKVFYAVDVDVITLYLAPANKSEYARVFMPEEDAGTRNVLARLIGNFIFREVRTCGLLGGRSTTLFILHPHDDELTSILFALGRHVVDAASAVQHLPPAALDELADRLKRDQPETVAQWLIDTAPRIVDVLDDTSGPRAEIARFEALEPARIVSLDRYKESCPEWAFPLPQTDTVPEDFEELTAATKNWQKRLLKHRSQQFRKQIDCDAYVLATLEILNTRMAGERRKIVLVTGTRGIKSAAEEYIVTLADGTPARFADLYIRHPQSFMADPLFFSSASAEPPPLFESKPFRLLEWLNLFFPKVTRQDAALAVPVIDREQLRELVERPANGFRDAVRRLAVRVRADEEAGRFPESMLEEWRTQVHSAGVSRGLADLERTRAERASRFMERLLGQLAQGITVKQVLIDLADRTVQSLSSLYSSTSLLGLHYSRLDPLRERIRGIPALRFDGFAQATDYCRQIVKTLRGGASTVGHASTGSIDLVEMYSRLSPGDESHYPAHVIHALAYATKGHWQAARTLCRIALAIADGLPEHVRRDRRGREAAYLLAVAERRLATEPKDLVVAARFLQEAIAREDVGKPTDVRFKSEATALEVARLNFEVFVEGNRSSALKRLEEICPRADELLRLAASDPLESAQEWVTQQVLTNVLDVALIVRDAGIELSSDILMQIRYCVSVAGKKVLLDGLGGHNLDEVAEFVWLVAAVVFGIEPSERAAAMRKLNELKFPVYAPFDGRREVAFRALAVATFTGETPPSYRKS
jgi:hypothetical protein